MHNPLPLEQLNNSFDTQVMAMRYLLLGLMEKNPEYKQALTALESARQLLAVLPNVQPATEAYQEMLKLAFDLYPTLTETQVRARQLAGLLALDTPAPLVAAAAAASLDAEDTLQSVDPEVPAMARVSGQFDKLFISMQFYLMGRIAGEPEYQVAYDALMYASTVHVGFRKDGSTPEFQHQLEIAHLIRTMLRGLIYPAETLATIFLHDTPEDYDVPRAEIERRFGPRVAHATMLLNKYDEQGQPKPLDDYYPALAYDAIASVAKPGDNGHNQSTMAGVFTYKKQFEYALNIKNRSWEMMKVARRLWPEQESVYENLKFLLRVQYNAVQAMLTAVEFDPATGQIHPALQA